MLLMVYPTTQRSVRQWRPGSFLAVVELSTAGKRSHASLPPCAKRKRYMALTIGYWVTFYISFNR